MPEHFLHLPAQYNLSVISTPTTSTQGVARSMRMMGLAQLYGANGDAKWNNRRNLAAPPTVERSVLLIGAAHNAKKAALRLKRPPYPSSAEGPNPILEPSRAHWCRARRKLAWDATLPAIRMLALNTDRSIYVSRLDACQIKVVGSNHTLRRIGP